MSNINPNDLKEDKNNQILDYLLTLVGKEDYAEKPQKNILGWFH